MLFGVAMFGVYGAGLTASVGLVRYRDDGVLGLLFKMGLLALLPFVALPIVAALLAPFYYDGACQSLGGELWVCSIWEFSELQMLYALLLPLTLNAAYAAAVFAIWLVGAVAALRAREETG